MSEVVSYLGNYLKFNNYMYWPITATRTPHALTCIRLLTLLLLISVFPLYDRDVINLMVLIFIEMNLTLRLGLFLNSDVSHSLRLG